MLSNLHSSVVRHHRHCHKCNRIVEVIYLNRNKLFHGKAWICSYCHPSIFQGLMEGRGNVLKEDLPKLERPSKIG